MSIADPDSLEEFLYAVKSNCTKSRYLNRLKNFFDYSEIEPHIKIQARAFVAEAHEKGGGFVGGEPFIGVTGATVSLILTTQLGASSSGFLDLA